MYSYKSEMSLEESSIIAIVITASIRKRHRKCLFASTLILTYYAASLKYENGKIIANTVKRFTPG